MINDTNTICITDDDSIEGIAEKIKSAPEPKINLVVFSRRSAVLSVFNLKLFKKIAESAGKSILVSTNDDTVKILAEKAGMPLNFFKGSAKFDSSPAGNSYEGGGEPGANKKSRSVDSIKFGKEFPHQSLSNGTIPAVENYPPKMISEFSVSGGGKKIFVFFLVLAAIMVGAVGYILLPTAKITVVPKTQPISVNFEFILNKNIIAPDIANKEIPATVMVAEAEKSGQFTATGSKEVSTKAAGIVTVYNECSTTPRSLKANNQLLAGNGKLFFTTSGIVVPGMVIEDGVVIPGSIDAPIIAAKPGPEYNIEPGDFTFTALRGANCQKITAKSFAPASGGASGYATVVSDSDLKKVEEFLKSEAEKDLLADLKEKKPSDLVLLPQIVSFKSGDLSASAKADQVANKFQATLKTSAIAFLFNEAYAKEIAKSIFTGDAQAEKNYRILNAYEINYSNPQILNPDKVKLSAEARSTAYQPIDEEKIKNKLLGKNQSEVEIYVKNEAREIDKIQISLWPFWVKNIPILERNIAIVTAVLDPVK